MKILVFGDFYTGLFTWLVLLYTATTTSAQEIVTETTQVIECPYCIKFDGLCYNSTYLLDLTAPFRQRVVIKRIGILRTNNVLYYSFEPTIEDEEYSKVAFVGLDTPENAGIITGQQKYNFGVFDMNQDEGTVYLGGSDGVFALNTKNGTFRPYSSIGDQITNIVLKDYMYFSKENAPGIFKKKGDEFPAVMEDEEALVIKNFVLDKDVEYIVVYLNATGLHAFDSKSGAKVNLSKNPFFRGLTVDLDGVVYAWWVDGIYKVVLEKNLVHSKVVKVANIPSIGAMAFDNENNIVFTLEKSLFRMTKTNLTEC